MRIEDVPQQPDAIYEGETKVIYAVNAEGKLTTASTSGWDAEIAALKDAIDEIDHLAQEALERSQAGLTSPLEYHMYHQRLDLSMLAQAMGKFQWQIRRHFKPSVFNRLSEQQCQAYAKVLGLDSATLKTLPGQESP